MDTLTHGDYKVGWICPLPIEVTAALAMLDGDEHPRLTQPHTDKNNYTLGRIGEHNVVITGLPLGRHGIPSATRVATNMMATFDSIEFYLLVGIGGGVPTKADIRLGDVVVSKGSSRDGGVVQYDAGKKVPGGFKRMWTLNAPPSVLAAALLRAGSQSSRRSTNIPQRRRIAYSLRITSIRTKTMRYVSYATIKWR
jgi:nucleoside phosphorylase